MAAGNMNLVLSLTGKDNGAVRLLQDTERQLARAALSRQQLARANKPYEAAGIRSERAIRREILQTEASFRRLARSGTASQNDLQRAAVATRNKIRELNAELHQGLGLQSKFGKGMAVGGAMLAGGMAAYGVLQPAMNNAKQLDANITQVAWQAYGEDNSKSAEWIATQGKADIKALALELVQANGGNADAALNLVNSMMANGMSYDEVKSNAHSSHKAMIAGAEKVGEYNPEDTARLMKVLSDFGFKGNDLGKAFEYAMKSGMQGNFEIADMVRELPALLPAAKAAGMDGLQGFGFLLSTLQSAANKAGSNSEAANNVRNLLEKTLSADTIKRLSKMANPNAPGQGIDWQASVLKGRENGESAVQVLARLANTMLEKDAEYQAYKKRADAGDKTAESQMNIMKGVVLSSLLPDIQAKGGLLAASDMAQVEGYMQDLMGLEDAASLVDKKNQVLQSSAAFQQEKAEAEALLKQDVSAAVEAETALKQLTAEYPNATLAMQTLTAAATAAAGALGVMSLLNIGGMVGAGGLLKGGLGGLLKGGLGAVGAVALPVAGAGGGLLGDAHQRINRNENKRFFEGGLDSRGAGYAQSAAGGAMLGAAVGSVIPVIGTAVGAAIGGVGGLIHAAVTDAVREKPPVPQAAQTPTPPPAATMPPVPTEPPEKLSPVITQQTATYQASILQQTGEYTAAVQANAEAVGARIDQISAALAAVNPTITNNMSVNLDGRVIANEVSRYQVAMFGRGAGQ
ncbi:PRTRC system protein F [Neisseria brasiliensis]|uniref:phage tail tape measure protein n=1 Tax=Neisseria TaxID=482 RepID=UPI000C27C788|nr:MULTISPECIES: phage tail tape measure protein [Neisseria]PJO78413.1 PRTRC system protein F [Neisseria sp. N177_16]QGL26094.1 PRTRC system protein F [Neisseria brasiliensis]